VIGAFNPFSTRSNKLYDKHFHKAVKFAMNIVKKELRNAKEIARSHKKVLAEIKKSNGDFLVLKKGMPWKKTVIDESKIKYVIHPKQDGQWRLTGVSINMNTFELRKPLPSSWGGLENEELAKVTGVEDAIFCHRKLFVASAKSKKGTITLAKLALKNQEN